MYKTVNLSILIMILAYCDGARILAIAPTPSYSHQIVYRPIWRELLSRGHHLTLLTTDPMNDSSLTNLTEIDLHSAYKLWNKAKIELTGNDSINPFSMINMFLSLANDIIDLELQHPEVKQMIKNETEHFDLLMIEILIPTMFAFAERFKCPIIAMTSLDAPNGFYQLMGNSMHPVLNPDYNLPFTAGELNFFERLTSVLFNSIIELMYLQVLPKANLVLEKHFGKGYPLVEELEKNITMLFVNANPIFHQIRPTVPAVVQIGGGIHMSSSKPALPVELKKYLDNAQQGFIYFSLGSNVEIKHIPETIRNVVLQVFAELQYKVLWKFEVDNLVGKPENVLISKWFPQQDILKHPNIKLFITQGGLQSMEEAIYNHVPMVGMPFFGDQLTNIKTLVSKGLGVAVDRENLNKEDFKNSKHCVSNAGKLQSTCFRYRIKSKELAKQALDQPMTGLERAVWWTEYVLRHKGAKHLRSPALDLPTYQYFLLDVIGFCVLLISIVVYLFIVIVRLIFKLMKYLLVSKPKIKVQ